MSSVSVHAPRAHAARGGYRDEGISCE